MRAPCRAAHHCARSRVFAARGVHAVAAIGNPQRFFDMLRDAGLTLYEHPMADHHAFKPGDLNFGDNLPVLMTEKDAVKCAAFADERCWYVPVTADFADERGARARRPRARARQGFKLSRQDMDDRLLDILACPVCKGPLKFQRAAQVLVCRAERLAFPMRDGVPMMLEEDARQLAPTIRCWSDVHGFSRRHSRAFRFLAPAGQGAAAARRQTHAAVGARARARRSAVRSHRRHRR